MTIKKVTVAGGGTLGSQIALMCALHGKDTVIWGRNDDSLKRVQSRIDEFLPKIQAYFNLNEQQVKDLKAHLTLTTDLKKAVSNSGLVIEALTENPVIKRDFYEQFAKVADPETILVTNTSTLLPSSLAGATDRPDKYLAYHFANEIWKNNTAEIMPQSKTNPELLKVLEQFSREIGMVPIVIKKEQPGYLLNSMLVPLLSSAQVLWAKGVADPKTIDKTWMIATGSPQGPFGMMDAIGMKTVYEISKNSSNPEVKASSDKFAEMIKANKLGKATGQGFYSYPHPAYEDPKFLK